MAKQLPFFNGVETVDVHPTEVRMPLEYSFAQLHEVRAPIFQPGQLVKTISGGMWLTAVVERVLMAPVKEMTLPRQTRYAWVYHVKIGSSTGVVRYDPRQIRERIESLKTLPDAA